MSGREHTAVRAARPSCPHGTLAWDVPRWGGQRVPLSRPADDRDARRRVKDAFGAAARPGCARSLTHHRTSHFGW
jgi:hypothetical protein